MNVELELLSNVVRDGDFSLIIKHGMTPEHFRTEEGKDVFRWLWGQFHDPSHRGEIPDRVRLMRKFPMFEYCPTRNSTQALAHELFEGVTRVRLREIQAEIDEYLTEGEDPNWILESYMPKFRELMVQGAEEDGLILANAGELLRQEYYTKQECGGITGIPYPWAILNRATGGMHPEDFIVFYARPKNGKSWLAMKLCVEAYENNRRVMVFSKEMRRIDMLRRAAAILARTDYAKLRAAELSEDDEIEFFNLIDALDEIEEDAQVGTRRRAMLFASDKGKRKASTVDDLIATAEKFEPDLILVDGLYLMRDGRSGSKNVDWKQIAHISQDLKGMGQYLHVPILGTTQANRSGAQKHSDDLDDLSYADALGQDADLACRMFKGPHPDGKGSAIGLTFPGSREAVLNPFLINFRPGYDFEVIDKNLDMRSFLQAKNRMAGEENKDGPKKDFTRKPGKRKRKDDGLRFQA